MKTHVEFRSSAFPAYEDEVSQINPGRWGRRLTEYIKAKLHEEKIASGEIRLEDWGVVLPLKNEEFPLWIGCGNYEEYADGFLCFIEPSKPYIRRWFRKIDTTGAVSRVAEALDRVLRANPEIRDIRWWEPEEERG